MHVTRWRTPPSLFASFFFLGLLLLIAVPNELSAQSSGTSLIRIRFPRGNAREVLLPVYVLIKLDAQANPATLRVTLNGQNISDRFKLTTGNQWQAQLNRSMLNVGQNSLRAVVSDKATGVRQTRRRNFYLDASARQNPDAANHARRRTARKLDDASVTFTPFNANLYSGSQTNTRQNFGHGMYIVKGWASLEPVISSWFLDAIQPDATNFPGLSPLWRWSELDWEFVPYTVSPQREQMLVNNAFPNPSVTIQRSDPTSCTPVNGQYDDNTLTQEIATLWNAGGQTRTAGNPTLVTPNTPITPTDFVDFAHNIALIPQSPVPYGFSLNPNYGTSGPQYWWSQTAPSFVSTWPLPCSILPVPPANEMANSVAVNVFRMPHGSLVTTGGVTNTITSTVIPDIDQSQLPNSQPKPGNLTNESFALIQNGVNLYSGWNTYTILVTPTFIAFYINAGSDGTDIENATPIRKLDMNDPSNPYPSLDAFGPNMIGADLPFEDYNDVPQPMGNLRFMLQNWVDGQGWSGPQPPENFTGANAYVQALQFYPLESGNGSQNADYSASPTFDLDTTQWTSANAQYNVMKNFHTLYGGNPMITNTQTTSPQLVQWTNAPDNTKALALGLVPIGDLPANANFFVLAPGGTQGQPSTYTAAKIDVPNQAYANAAFPQTDAFWGPVGVPITVTVWYVENPSNTCSGQIQLNDNLTWSVVSVANGCAPILPAPPFTSGNNTIGLGTGF
jgi:hypothetical protein